MISYIYIVFRYGNAVRSQTHIVDINDLLMLLYRVQDLFVEKKNLFYLCYYLIKLEITNFLNVQWF